MVTGLVAFAVGCGLVGAWHWTRCRRCGRQRVADARAIKEALANCQDSVYDRLR